MKKILHSIMAIVFILWILPLGCFIKPAQEKAVCDGQRAMCMCHVFVPKASDKAMEAGIVLKTAPTTKENSSSAGNYFISRKPVVLENLHLTSIFENQFLAYKNPFLASIEYVPKV